ncbi:MAG: bifunctional metallophosphatase/5'-nucleotidase [Lachnospiraceae bacterium]|jgi:2',3'-cyclic-nucleotide 2'-phosphodiesterase (5'-nucleotidase family)|nr:bifunctional metallophosphatase/5'-nucleotidase [Lachnospiraceae bacterium]
MKKLLSILLAATLVMAAGCGEGQVEEVAAPTPEPTEAPVEETVEDTTLGIDKDIVVLYVNDVHCGIEDNLGYQDLVTVKNAYEAMGHTVLLVDNGDAIQGDIVGTLSKGEAIINIMNEAGFDVAVPGNHEFDYGMERFLELSNKADFDYVSCNFVDKNGEAVFEPYFIKEVDGVKIAFVGVCTPKTLTTSTPAYFMDDNGKFIYSFEQDETGEKLYACVQEAVDGARADGAQFVIALTHLGTEADCSPWMSTEVIENTTGIDAVLDGHSHSVWVEEHVKDKDGNEVILTSTGTKLANIGVLTISNDKTLHSTLVNDAVSEEETMQDVIDAVNEENEEIINTVVAHTDVDLVIADPATDERIVRVAETNLGDLCADAYRAMSGADIAFVNGGGVRSTINAGDITYGDIIKVHPFGNSMCMVEATGEEIYEALEMSANALPAEYGGFLQVSGLSFTIDVNVESPVVLDENKMFVKVDGDARVKDIMVGEEPLDLEKTYTVACHDYLLLNMGDGYTMFADNNVLLDSVMIDNQVLINYIVDKLEGTVGEEYSDPYGEGRIKIID